MPKKVHKYGAKAEFLDFYPSSMTREQLAEEWGSEFLLKDFFKSQAGVNGKLKFWEFRCIHFPAIDKFLNNAFKSAIDKANTALKKQFVSDEYPTNELLTLKPGTSDLVWPIWVVSTRERPDEDLLMAPFAIIDHDDESSSWHELGKALGVEKIYAGPLLGLTKIEESKQEELENKLEAVANKVVRAGKTKSGKPAKSTTEHMTTNGKKLFSQFRKMTGRSVGYTDSLQHCIDFKLGQMDAPATVFTQNVWDIINFYFVKCLGEEDLHDDGTYLCEISNDDSRIKPETFNNVRTLKTYRMPWSHSRVLEETGDFLSKDSTNIITDLIAKHSYALVMDQLRDELGADESAVHKLRPKFEKWRDALKAFRGIGFEIPDSLESVSAIAKASESERREEREEAAITGLTDKMAKLQIDLEKIVEWRKRKQESITGGNYGEIGAGQVIQHGKDGTEIRRIAKVPFVNYEAAYRRISAVMSDYAYSKNPFEFRGSAPELVRVGQAKYTHTEEADKELFVEDFAGYHIKGLRSSKEKVSEIIEEFNKEFALHNWDSSPLGQPPSEAPRLLTKDWVDYVNSFPLDKLHGGQSYIIPDPRSLPLGNPPKLR